MTAHAPDVSFVIAAYNAADTIRDAVESALVQEGVAVEVLVVDDRSSDDTREIVAAIADPRVRLIALEENRGPGGARNAGFEEARGRWIAVLDSDDTVRPGRLARLIGRAQVAEAQIVVDNLDVVTANGLMTRMFPEEELARHAFLTLPAFIESNILFRSQHNFGYMKPVFERRFLEEKHLRFDESLRIGEDYILLASALAQGGRCAVEPRAGYVYHIREGSISRVLKRHHVDAMIAADETFLREHTLEPEAASAQKRRSRSLREAQSFITLVDHLKQRSLLGALKIAFRDPTALRHLRMPVAARLRRIVAPLARITAAAPGAAFESSTSGKGPHTSKG
ncbi:MAG: glycosyltransferase family 2 protein [Shinella sp.]|nr:glycosyltransferase family 2 protein [Shinella sp.]